MTGFISAIKRQSRAFNRKINHTREARELHIRGEGRMLHIAWRKRSNASSSGGAGFYEAFCGMAAKYEAHLRCMKRFVACTPSACQAPQGMKRSLDRFHFRHFLSTKMAEREGFDEERVHKYERRRAGARSAEATLIKKSLALRAKQSEIKKIGGQI